MDVVEGMLVYQWLPCDPLGKVLWQSQLPTLSQDGLSNYEM